MIYKSYSFSVKDLKSMAIIISSSINPLINVVYILDNVDVNVIISISLIVISSIVLLLIFFNSSHVIVIDSEFLVISIPNVLLIESISVNVESESDVNDNISSEYEVQSTSSGLNVEDKISV